jgi:regulator of sigma E protease
MNLQLIIEFIIALGALIFVHEFGHFIICKLLKIEVEEFGFGIPPRALTLFERGGTKFTLNWLPLGGFVRPKGENDPNIPGSFAAHKPWKRIAVFLAGPTMNLLTAVFLFAFIYGILGFLPDRNRVQLVDIVPDSPAAQAGLLAGDILVTVDGQELRSMDNVRTLIYAKLGKPMDVTYERDGILQNTTVTPLLNPGDTGAVGIVMNYPTKPFTIGAVVPEAFNSLYEYCKELFSMLGQIIRGQADPSQGRLTGVVGMFDLYKGLRESASTPGVPKIVNVMLFIAGISISLGLMNLLPIPALDGGRILFVLPELILHRRIPQKYENVVNLVSFALLIGLMIFINLQDIIHPITLPTP